MAGSVRSSATHQLSTVPSDIRSRRTISHSGKVSASSTPRAGMWSSAGLGLEVRDVVVAPRPQPDSAASGDRSTGGSAHGVRGSSTSSAPRLARQTSTAVPPSASG